MNIRNELIRLLSDGQFHSGEGLAEHFGVSRAAIWKQLSQLKQQFGLEIGSVKGKGYRLGAPLELLDEQRIRSALGADGISRLKRLDLELQISSTNSFLMDQPHEALVSGQVCMAEQQTAGRGRRGRSWISPFGSNIYLSLYWRFNLAPAQLSGLSLAAGLAVVRALESLGLSGIGLKWPNDVLVEGRKLAGLLLEMNGEQGGPSHVVLGVGLNTQLSTEQANEIDQPWTDLAQLSEGDVPSRNQVASALIEHMLASVVRFERDGLAPFIDEWQQRDLLFGHPVIIQLGDQYIEGVHRGIDGAGALRLETDGEIRVFHGGEVSLRRG